MLNAKLIIVGGDAKAGEVPLKQFPASIGRGREATLMLPHPLVSRMHCEIFERDGRLVVKDLGSLNGTFVNNQRIETEEVLEPDQLLTLGNVTFRAIYNTEDRSAPPQEPKDPKKTITEVRIDANRETVSEIPSLPVKGSEDHATESEIPAVTPTLNSTSPIASSISIDLGEEPVQSVDADSKLDSFLRKMPS